MKNILWVGDFVTPTGFSRVNDGIVRYLPTDKYNIQILAVNYHGDPHDYNYLIYPAKLGGDVYGLGRIKMWVDRDVDLIFILNDPWIINKYLEKIKEVFNKEEIPEIVVYFPVDGEDHLQDWYQHFDIVTRAFTYTEFGKSVVDSCVPGLNIEVMPHGVDTKDFYKIKAPKKQIKARVYPNEEEFLDSFIILNANRNQFRKRIDLAVEGFFLFTEGKPDNIKYYHHAGVKDAGWNIVDLFRSYNTKRKLFEKRLVLTSTNLGIQTVPTHRLNLIYNATDLGINTSLGEGWGLTNIEHAVTGSPQIVPNHSALPEVFGDTGYLIPTIPRFKLRYHNTLTTGKLVHPEDVAKQLELAYSNRELYEEKIKNSLDRFTSREFSWETISKRWDRVFDELWQ